MPRNPEFDPDKPYATTRSTKNVSGAKYVQNGRLYTVTGEYVGVAPGHSTPVAPKKPVVPQAAKETAADKKKKALAAAADKLGLDSVPDSLKEAAKENAEALAAEENA